MDKKAQGLSMNVIIVAALALIVLVVLSVIFMSRAGIFAQSTGECITNGGTCMDNEAGACQGDLQSVSDNTCLTKVEGKKVLDTEKICCIDILK